MPGRETVGGAVAKDRRKRGGPDRNSSPAGVPPVKAPPWKRRYIPVYFWVGGVAGGSWLALSLEDALGERDAAVIRTGRYLGAAGVAASTVLLVLDLGRPERFLNMLRIVRARSAMSLGAWGLSAFGAVGGAAAALQAAEDLGLGAPGRWSRGPLGRLLNLGGLPLALFVGSYTGILIGATNVPAWGARSRLLGPLFVASAASSGLAAVSAGAELGGGSPGAQRRLARAETLALGGELGLALAARQEARRRLPSAREEPPRMRLARWATIGAGVALPLALKALDGFGRRPRSGRGRSLLAAGLALGGSLAMRLLITEEGRRSAQRDADTWAYASNGRGSGERGGSHGR